MLIAFSSVKAAKIQVIGGAKEAIPYTNIAGSRLDNVFVLYGLDNTKLSYTSTSNNLLKWFKYTTNVNNLTPLKASETLSTTLDALENNTGYILADGTDTMRVWIIDYTKYAATALSVSATNDNPCDELHLTASAPLFGMGYNEAVAPSYRKLLDIQLPLTYKTMEYQEGNGYVSKNVTETLSTLKSDILIASAPLMNTTFTLGNDIFAAQWSLNKVVTPEYTAVAVSAKGAPKHTPRDAENELEKEKGDLGGSAPVDVLFKAYANEPTATYYKWDIATDDKYAHIVASFPDKEVRYTFSDAKIYYARLSVSNNSNSCVDSSQVYTIEVTESNLVVPQAFSPNGDGKNDEFKVAYKSLVKFNAWIFNRWGNQLFSWSDPSKGWDGKVGGKYVLPGVYFYVIEAVGSEGKKWKKSGDINVFSDK